MIHVGDHWAETKSKPAICPSCEAESVADILWGYPVMTDELLEKMAKKQIHFGGPLFTDDDPLWRCEDCGLEIYKQGKEHFAVNPPGEDLTKINE